MEVDIDIIPLIKYLGIVEDEIEIDFEYNGDIVFNSIEWRRETNSVILHKFDKEMDYEYPFEDMPFKLKKEIFNLLLKISF